MNRSDVIHRLREMGKTLQDDECYSDGEFLMDVADAIESDTYTRNGNESCPSPERRASDRADMPACYQDPK